MFCQPLYAVSDTCVVTQEMFSELTMKRGIEIVLGLLSVSLSERMQRATSICNSTSRRELGGVERVRDSVCLYQKHLFPLSLNLCRTEGKGPHSVYRRPA